MLCFLLSTENSTHKINCIAISNAMDEKQFAAEINSFMNESGKLAELRTKLRFDLIEALSKKNLGKKKKNTRKSEDNLALNSLILEHFLRNGNEYSASVFNSEVDKNGFLIAVEKSDKLTDDELEEIVRILALKQQLDLESLKVSYYRRKDQSLLAAIFNEISSKNRNEGLMEKLDKIENLLRNKSDKELVRKIEGIKDQLRDEGGMSPDSSKAENSRRSDLYPTISEVDSLREQLREARTQIEQLKSTAKEFDDLRLLVQAQKAQLEDLGKVGQSDANDFNEGAAASVDGFVDKIRSKVKILHQSSNSIDKQLSDMI